MQRLHTCIYTLVYHTQGALLKLQVYIEKESEWKGIMAALPYLITEAWLDSEIKDVHNK